MAQPTAAPTVGQNFEQQPQPPGHFGVAPAPSSDAFIGTYAPTIDPPVSAVPMTSLNGTLGMGGLSLNSPSPVPAANTDQAYHNNAILGDFNLVSKSDNTNPFDSGGSGLQATPGALETMSGNTYQVRQILHVGERCIFMIFLEARADTS